MSIPVLVISYNNPTYVRTIVEQIQKYTSNFYVIDNASSFPPHVEYLKTLGDRVVYMEKNYGHSVYYEPRVWALSGDKFIITDPDLLLNPNMPTNAIEILSELSDTYQVNKVGLALDISGNIRDDYHQKSGETIVEWESQFWKKRIPHETYELYDAALDTTFSLFNKRIPGYSAIRIAGDFTCKHRPWYTGWESELLPGELDAYRNNNVSSHYTLATPTNWTVVTAYFDLTKMPDASRDINARPVSHYLKSAMATMTLNQNLVVFCEPDTVEILRALRPVWLLPKTKFIPMSFEDFPLTKYRDQILENRKKMPDFDNRNTASYYLLCMARYAMLKQVIAENPFGSTHFAWLNICIERMGPKNVEQLPRVFEINRDKFSTCYIDYQRKENYLENVMRWGRCSMCSGFFTGNAHYMKTFCDRIEQTFLDCLEKGYGHADEQLYSLVYFDDPSIFDVYYGDYTEMVTNYEWIRDRPQQPLYLLIKHSYEAGDIQTCLKGCLTLWRSWKKGYAKLSELEVTHLIWYYEHCLPSPRELE